MFRWIFGLLFLAVIVGVGVWCLRHPALFLNEPEKPVPTPTATAEVRDIEEALSTTGEVRPGVSTEVKSEVSGVVKEVRVQAGDRVKRGDLLITLDPKELKSQLDAAELSIKTIQLRLKKTQEEWERNRQLWQKKLVPEKEYLDSQTDVDMANNDMAVQRANVDNIRQQLTKTEIRAPHDGIVLNLDAQEGAVIVGANSFSSGTVLMEVANMDRKKINIDINEIDVMKVRTGMPVEVSFESIPGLKIEGKITFVSPSAGSSKSSGGGAMNRSGNSGGGNGGRTFPVTVNMESKDERIRPGMTATIKLPLGKVSKAVAVPVAAVFVDEEDEAQQRYVYIKSGEEKFTRKNVKTGVNDRQWLEVTDGLAKGDVITRQRPKDAAEQKKASENPWD